MSHVKEKPVTDKRHRRGELDAQWPEEKVVSQQLLAEAVAEQAEGCFWREGLGPLRLYGQADLGCLLLAHGAGAGQRSAFMQQFASALARRGLQVITFDLGYMQQMQATGKRRPPPAIERSVAELARWYACLSPLTIKPLWLGGKSMGGRVASMLASEQPCPGLVIAGYPFHPPKAPDRLRLAHWSKVPVPALILQGERDPLGNRDEVAGYALPDNARVTWLTDGDHDFKPRRASGLDQTILIDEAAAHGASFVRAQSPQ
ncbi:MULTISPECIES: alpha/beta fold hydrolase [Halomonadaceae]|mgnify:CR=1 FL=1|uniref:alpha/beta fold hydrolase n=1 Tax=Halomonadaceae TaxID=28256 RepID=UPI00285AF12B|nr:alpha/beta fold hydrolase [Halomonas janggokensis]MDR5884453.1 alpha/beta fold hydrolase [Halomonas janggokensis]